MEVPFIACNSLTRARNQWQALLVWATIQGCCRCSRVIHDPASVDILDAARAHEAAGYRGEHVCLILPRSAPFWENQRTLKNIIGG